VDLSTNFSNPFLKEVIHVYAVLFHTNVCVDADGDRNLFLWHGTQKLFGIPIAMPMELPAFVV
jgi:hypothetical protein